MVWYGMVWYGVVWYGMVHVWYGVEWCGMVWNGVVWNGMVWNGMVWYGIIPRPSGQPCGRRGRRRCRHLAETRGSGMGRGSWQRARAEGSDDACLRVRMMCTWQVCPDLCSVYRDSLSFASLVPIAADESNSLPGRRAMAGTDLHMHMHECVCVSSRRMGGSDLYAYAYRCIHPPA